MNHPISILDQIQFAFFVFIACLGLLGNSSVIVNILFKRPLRKASSAFIMHQAILDFLRCIYSLMVGHSIFIGSEPPLCRFLGSAFIVCVTSSAFNLLAMVMNESYLIAEWNAGEKDTSNSCCILFGVTCIWFTSIILNLGVAFLPATPSYVPDVGHCTFEYGITRNYILHLLWITLISMALILAIMYLKRLYLELQKMEITGPGVYRPSEDMSLTSDVWINECPDGHKDDRRFSFIKRDRGAGRKDEEDETYNRNGLHAVLLLLGIFLLFWYPLFCLIIIDKNYSAPPLAYRWLTMLACASASVNPSALWIIMKNRSSSDRIALSSEKRALQDVSLVQSIRNKMKRSKFVMENSNSTHHLNKGDHVKYVERTDSFYLPNFFHNHTSDAASNLFRGGVMSSNQLSMSLLDDERHLREARSVQHLVYPT